MSNEELLVTEAVPSDELIVKIMLELIGVRVLYCLSLQRMFQSQSECCTVLFNLADLSG